MTSKIAESCSQAAIFVRVHNNEISSQQTNIRVEKTQFYKQSFTKWEILYNAIQ
jgi:hypothetical protein